MEIYNKNHENILVELNSTKDGLSLIEAKDRLIKNGKNELTKEKKKPLFVLFLQQMANTMTIVLLIAAIISGFFGEWLDAAIIMFVVLLNAVLGVTQESKAEKAIEAIQKLSSQKTKVKRDGHTVLINSNELVTGDIVLLEAGDSIPCDLRIIESYGLKIEEAALTGESIASEKHTEALEGNVLLGDRKNMAFMGTNVIYGRGIGLVVTVGMNTEMGKIANILNTTKAEITPLARQINSIGKILSIAVLVICTAIFGINILYHLGTGINTDVILDSFMSSISLAVAAIPEGLTAVIALVMTLGVTRLSKNNAIIRKLPSIETLGCTEIICSDKTGTLTQNKMTIQEVYTLTKNKASIDKLITISLLCNDSTLDADKILGDPTETALFAYAQKEGYDVNGIIKENPRIGELPFDSTRKLMSTINKTKDNKNIFYVKGATDELLNKCKLVLINDTVVPLDEQIRAVILAKNKEFAEKALRVLAFAYRNKKKDIAEQDDEKALVFTGLMGMSDPVRPEVKDAVKKCISAGITPIMITGDHLITAIAIGKEAGIITNDNQAITGRELDKLSDAEFEKSLDKYKVYARVSPENKVRIIKFWKARGKICAMTGDGVNDAPALKTANIGVGMGITGTDVTKNVADIVLADDNFATIIVAVEEGRKIYDNIKKTVQFLLSSNACEVLVLLIATLCNFTILKPIHILWVNLVTDTVPALGLGLETAENDVMNRNPRNPKTSIFAGKITIKILYQSIFMTGLILGAFFIGNMTNQITGMTMAFASLSFVQIAHSFNLKSAKKSIINKNLYKNKVLSLGALVTAILTLGLIYIPGLNTSFGLTPLSLANLVITFAISISIIIFVEIVKFFTNLVNHNKEK